MKGNFEMVEADGLFSVKWITHDEFAHYDWKPTTLGPEYFKRYDKDRRYQMAVLYRSGAFVMESPIWNQIFSYDLYQKQVERLKSTEWKDVTLSEKLAIEINVAEGDEAFYHDLFECSYINKLFFMKTDNGGALITNHLDKTYTLKVHSQ